jgi:hypothetical protein
MMLLIGLRKALTEIYSPARSHRESILQAWCHLSPDYLGRRGAAIPADAVRRNARLVGYLDCGDAGVVRNRNRPRD